MTRKQRKNIMLSPETIDNIIEKSNQQSLSHSQVIENILNEYFEKDPLEEKINEMNKLLKRVWLTGNVIDRHTKMMIEFWNHYFFVKKFDAFATTEKVKRDEIIQSENLIRKRIAESRQRKIDAQNRK